jgi:hypothetical protein
MSALSNLALYLRRARDNALAGAELAAESAGTHPSITQLIEVESQLDEAEVAEHRLAMLERLQEGN